MGREERQKIISEIEDIRSSKVITYFLSTKPKIRNQIEQVDIRTIYDHLSRIGYTDKIDLFLYSLGGFTEVAWTLANLIREFTNNFTVLVPSFAFSCATSIALGADKIIMDKMGALGPVDPMVTNIFNPKIDGQTAPISVEDIAGYISLLKDKMELKDERNLSDLLLRLGQTVHPLALGNAFRHYLKSRDDTKKLLELHLDPNENEVLIERIVNTLVEKLYFHGHHIPRTEAKSIGLNVQNAEKFAAGNGRTLDTLMWELFMDYEKDMNMRYPYSDKLPLIGDKRIISIKMVESIGLTSAFVMEQKYTKIDAPKGSFFTKADDLFAIAYIQPERVQVVPYDLMGDAPTNINGELYKKEEVSYWRNFSKDIEVNTPDKPG